MSPHHTSLFWSNTIEYLFALQHKKKQWRKEDKHEKEEEEEEGYTIMLTEVEKEDNKLKITSALW